MCVCVLALVLGSSEYAVGVCVCFESGPAVKPEHRQAHFPGVPHFQLICCSPWPLICVLEAAGWAWVTTAEMLQLQAKR